MNDLMKKIHDIYNKEENDFLKINDNDKVSLSALYLFYHYFNADVTRLDELNGLICCSGNEAKDVVAINNNYFEDNAIDFLFTLSNYEFGKLSSDEKVLSYYLEEINKSVANIICRNYSDDNLKAISMLDEFNLDDNTMFYAKLLINGCVEIDRKIMYQEIASKYIVNNGKIKFELVFLDDIEEEISDIENPKNSVETGEFDLYNSESLTFFGEEKSFIGFIGAFSLKRNYYLYSTHGLFASNLRYYVKSAKIDSQIINTIQNEPENFCYYNNGIIITCSDYFIKGKKLILKNFSIVNGGQTTNLIGRTDFEHDFSIMCKVIKNKYSNLEQKVNFLSKVAEASNTQKPIKIKDLIANRPEQRLLKIQYQKVNVFLQVKRGEKISKELYSEPWQNATNDNVAQMLNSFVYQMPGYSKNSKSKLLENEKTYQKIFKSEYSSDCLVALQHIKVGFHNWVKHLKKKEAKSSQKLMLAKHGDLITLATIGLVIKLNKNKTLVDEISKSNNKNSTDVISDEKFLFNQNDIGGLKIFNDSFASNVSEKSMFALFDYLFDEILIPGFNGFRKKYPTYSFGVFVKSDLYYYNFVVPIIIKKYDKKNVFDLCSIFNIEGSYEFKINVKSEFNEYKPGLEEELKEYRTNIFKNSNGTIPTYEVFKNIQLVNLVRIKPRTQEDLRLKVKFSENQCKRYGQDIIRIIEKYVDFSEYMKER